MNTSDVPPQIFRDAIDEVNAHLSEWPESEWLNLSNDFDLWLFTDGDGTKVAEIFAIVNGETDTENFLQIFSQSEIEPRLP